MMVTILVLRQGSFPTEAVDSVRPHPSAKISEKKKPVKYQLDTTPSHRLLGSWN
jgi:hypothetical protein